MKSSLEVLGKYKNRKIAVLGDMLELGDYSTNLHEEVGKAVVKNKIDIFIDKAFPDEYLDRVYNNKIEIN